MSATSAHYSIELLRVGDHERDGIMVSRSVIRVDKGLTHPEAVRALVTHYSIATPDEAARLLEQAVRLADMLPGTGLDQMYADPTSFLRIHYGKA